MRGGAYLVSRRGEIHEIQFKSYINLYYIYISEIYYIIKIKILYIYIYALCYNIT